MAGHNEAIRGHIAEEAHLREIMQLVERCLARLGHEAGLGQVSTDPRVV